MHSIQQKLLKLSETCNLGIMSLRDIARIIGEDHPQIVKHHLDQLEKKGFISWDREQKTITKLVTGVTSNLDFSTIPVLGSANCGDASLYADENIVGHIKVSSALLGRRSNVFAVKAVGHSMNSANIAGKNIDDGDLVIVDASDRNVRSNDYVLSVIDGVANIKKIVIDRLHSQISLHAESTFSYPPIYIEQNEASKYLINGKVVQVIKTGNV